MSESCEKDVFILVRASYMPTKSEENFNRETELTDALNSVPWLSTIETVCLCHSMKQLAESPCCVGELL